MALPQRTVLLQNVARAASDDVSTDLPVNPLLMLLYTLRVEQLAASTTVDKIVSLANILADVSKFELLFRGSAIVSGSLADIMVMNALLTGRWPFIINQTDVVNQALSVTIPIYLGRPWLAGAEAFPATRRGEFTLHRTFGATLTNQVTTTITEQVEAWELLDATPASFLKYVTLSKTFATSGDNDVDLPMGNPLLGTLLFGTTGFTATTSVATWKQTKLLVDNVEYMYALTNWETLHGELNRRLPLASEWQAHTHRENLAATYAANALTTIPAVHESVLDNYAYLDFDPYLDGKYTLETAGRGRVHLRVTAGTADAARALPLEVVSLPGAAAG